MKHLLLAAAFFLVMVRVQSQNVGIGTPTPATILDVVSTTKGVLIPRLTTIQMNAIVSPANGLIVTNTDSLNRLFIYTGTAWKGLSFMGEGSFVDTSLLVHKAGTEIIAGIKLFDQDIVANGVTIGKGGGADSTNTAIGNKALFLNFNGSLNAALGFSSLGSNTGGIANTAIGNTALFSNIDGGINTAVGYQSLYSNLDGNFNTAVGGFALYNQIDGTNNTAYGFIAGYFLEDGVTSLENADNSLFLGTNTMAQADNQTNQVVIGNDAIGDGSNSVVIGSSSVISTKLQGQLKLPAYGTGSNLGTAVYNLATDISGNIIEVPTGGGGNVYLANNQTFTGRNIFDSTLKVRQYKGSPGLVFEDKSTGDSVTVGLVAGVGGGADLLLSNPNHRIVIDGYALRVLSRIELPNGLTVTMGNQPFQIDAVTDLFISTAVTGINLIHGGYNKATEINSYTGYPLIINDGSANNGNGEVRIGSSTMTGGKLNVNGIVKSSQYALSSLNTAPSSATDTGTLGEVRITATFIYVCTATNTWVRSPLATW